MVRLGMKNSAIKQENIVQIRDFFVTQKIVQISNRMLIRTILLLICTFFQDYFPA